MKRHCTLSVWCFILRSAPGAAAKADPFTISSSASFRTPLTLRRKSPTPSTTRILRQLRGGAPPPSYYETNPNYPNFNPPDGPTLGDLDDDIHHGHRYPPPSSSTFSFHRTSIASSKPPPITTVLSNYFSNLKTFSPTLFYTTAASMLLFLLWNLFPPPSPFSKRILQTHFVCSRHNIIERRRWDAALLSAVSHTSFRHLMVNLYGLLTFGPSVKRTLDGSGGGGDFGLGPFVTMSAIFGSLSFLLWDRLATRGMGGSCIGLSGVTLALLAFDSLVYPSKELSLFVGFLPVRLPAYYLLMGLVGWSALGVVSGMGNGGGGNVAHSTHLGGLAFGALFYEAFSRGYVRLWNYRMRRLYFQWKRLLET
ncbi:hypothetical protein ACHAXS_010458 [Conticribra weissflogii]